jgi:glycosyltransferase involved in cell wall biosynthesis
MTHNSGVSAARNAGIRLSGSPFVAFIDADDVWLPNKLELQMQIFRKDEERIGLVHSSIFPMDELGGSLSESLDSLSLLSGNVFSKLLREGNIVTGSASSVLIRRDVLDAAGTFDESLSYGEDWDMWLRVAAISKFDHTPEAVVGIRLHPDSAQKRNIGDSVDRFLQTMRVYCRWETSIEKDRALVSQIRRYGFVALLASMGSLRQAEVLRRTLKASNHSFARNLFAGPLDFWAGLFVEAIKKVFRKTMRTALGKHGVSRAGST